MRPSSRSAAAIIALASTRALSVDAFAAANVDIKYSSLASGTDPARAGRHHHHHRRRGSIFGNSKNRSSSSLRSAIGEATAGTTPPSSPSPSPSAPPSWEELSNTLRDATTTTSSSSSIEPTEPLVTLYRDTNGWCPFCERVWIILRAKGIPYDEQLISLQNKPEWYKALVPTTLVPAVLFHGETGDAGDDGDDGEGKKKKNERRIVWESADIIRALEEEFPNTPRMLRDTPEYDAAVKMNDDLTSAGFRFIYAGRNDTLSEEDRSERRDAFLSELDRLDAALKVQQQQQQQLETTSASSSDGGDRMHFRLGADFTAADAIMIPTLERWRIQLPLAVDVDILEGRPALTKWFEAVDSYAPYSERVMGDEYSWTATNSVFLRIFGGGEDEPEVAAAIRRADDAAARLTESFAAKAAEEREGDDDDDDDDVGMRKKFSREAASKLVSNREAVIADCTREDPKSQRHLGRASDVDAADVALRIVVGVLLSEGDPIARARESTLPDMENAKGAASAARTVAARLCVPRDMGAPAASILRAVLAIVADRLEGKTP